MKRAADSRGQATVEMAIVLPVLLWLLMGLIDVARMSNGVLTVQHAAREAVRAGIAGASDTAVEERARDAMSPLEQSKVSVAISPTGARRSGTDLTVTVTYDYTFLALFNKAGTSVDLTGTMTGRVE